MMLELPLLNSNDNVDGNDDDNNNREFVERFQRIKALYSLIIIF